MVPKVLTLNPLITPKEGEFSGLIPTSWDAESFWMDEGFSFSKAFSSSISLFILLEARSAFVVSILDPKASTYFAGMSQLSTLLFFLRTSSSFYSTTSIDSVVHEYTSKSQDQKKEKSYAQMVLWEKDLSEHLEFLGDHARVILASSVSMPQKPLGFDLHKTWSYGSDSEIGSLYLMELTR